jgi:DNA ligase (NAD+)
MDAREEIRQLTAESNEANYRYYVLDDPTMPDFEYDRKLRRLENLEAEHPELKAADSPTQRVGGQALSQFEKVTHAVPLESLQDVFSYEELFSFGDRMDNLLEDVHDYVVEPKIDGLSMSLEYENGVFVRGASPGGRRDGRKCHGASENCAFSAAANRERAGASDRPRRSLYGQVRF